MFQSHDVQMKVQTQPTGAEWHCVLWKVSMLNLNEVSLSKIDVQ